MRCAIAALVLSLVVGFQPTMPPALQTRIRSRTAARTPEIQDRFVISATAATPPPPRTLSEAACFGISWLALTTLAAAAVATRSMPGPPLALWRSVLAGGLAAALGEALFINVEVAKVRLQQRSDTSLLAELRALLVSSRGASSSLLVSLASAPGVVAGVVRAIVYHGLRLGLFPPIRRALEALLAGGGGATSGALGLGGKVLIGAFCGALGAALCTPLDLVKARLAVNPDESPNSMAALLKIARGGVASLWPRGAVVATVVRAALGSGAQLACYAEAKRVLTTLPLLAGRPGGGALAISLATTISAAAYVTASAPADLVKTRLMVKGSDGQTYSGPWDCLRRSAQRDGLGVLFRGWGASFGRLLPILLLVMPLLERLRALFGVGGF